MTEDEAKTKWCPMVRRRESGQAEPAVNIGFDGRTIKCRASECMMWVSEEFYYSKGADIKDSRGKVIGYEANTKTTGHCGLSR